MNLPDNNILLAAKDYVITIFEKASPAFHFHNLAHTQGVVRACIEMADHYQLIEEDRFSLMLAAWFHDTGYRNGQGTNHEESSIAIAREFLERHQLPEVVRDKAVACIGATRIPQKPVNLQQQIICDADLFHLGSNEFWEKSKSLRQELNDTGAKHMSKEEWAVSNIKFLETHTYFTAYCKERLEPVKQEHVRRLRKKLNFKADNTMIKEASRLVKITNEPLPELKKEEDKKEEERRERKVRVERPERGIETMFRTTAANHLKLSEMADSKAHIMISVNSIIISIIISVLLEKLETYSNFIIPTSILLLMCVVTIIFAVLATRPNVTSGTFTKEDIQQKKANLLFLVIFTR